MHSPQQIFKGFSGLGGPVRHTHNLKKAGDSMAGSSPGNFLTLVCTGFADILALPGEKPFTNLGCGALGAIKHGWRG
jgi:hypothetical protein